jgi:hypothetical protein
MNKENPNGMAFKSSFIQAIDKNLNEYKLFQNKINDLDKKLTLNLIKYERESYLNRQIYLKIKNDLSTSKSEFQLNTQRDNVSVSTRFNPSVYTSSRAKRPAPRYFDLIKIRQTNSASSLKTFLISSIKNQETLSKRSLPVRSNTNYDLKNLFKSPKSDSFNYDTQTDLSTDHQTEITDSTETILLPAISQLPSVTPLKSNYNRLSKMKSKSYRELPKIKIELGLDSAHSINNNNSLKNVTRYKSIRRERTSAKKLNDKHDAKTTILKIQKKYELYENVCSKHFQHVHSNY